jgi:hypothetical protein
MWVFNSIVEFVFWVGNWFWDNNFVDNWSGMDIMSWGVMYWQWSVDRASSH